MEKRYNNERAYECELGSAIGHAESQIRSWMYPNKDIIDWNKCSVRVHVDIELVKSDE